MFKTQCTEKEGDAPARVKPGVQRLRLNIEVLCALHEGKVPARRLVRGNSISKINLIFGDALGAGFGTSWQVQDDIHHRFGLWRRDMDFSSSNLRE